MPGQQGGAGEQGSGTCFGRQRIQKEKLWGGGEKSEDGGDIRSRAARVCYCERFGGDGLETHLFTEKYDHTQRAYPLGRGSLTWCEDIYFSSMWRHLSESELKASRHKRRRDETKRRPERLPLLRLVDPIWKRCDLFWAEDVSTNISLMSPRGQREEEGPVWS